MNRSTINAAVTMEQLQQKLNTIADNLANANTNGFKRRETSFADLLVQQINNQPLAEQEVGRLTPAGIRSGSGARLAATTLKTEQGAINETGRTLDVALRDENVYFQLENNGETEYTRDGAFYVTPSQTPGYVTIVASDGAYLRGENGRIDIPDNFEEISISESGEVTVKLPTNDVVSVGQIQLANIHRPQLLQSVGNNRFTAPDPVDDVLQTVVGQPVFQQGALEASNVEISEEMTNLLEMQRHYQLNARSLSMANDMMGLVNQLR